MLGQIDLAPFDKLAPNSTCVLEYIVLLTHSALSIVMPMNVIVAMMNKTMDGVMEKAKRKAYITFVQCVLRCEKIQGLVDIGDTEDSDSFTKSQKSNKKSTNSQPTACWHKYPNSISIRQR
ncbi:hypothetical protein THRCLA_21685 [Thraustotheca clavata]|uniref:Uncharacterized protein n=1 Tax=Thraustotheca clavata TaxID=74557 RepID=A0A1V9ZR21_9STRA|nr:hypothetical protein THRCLA_21685 [Thraustotheca clavata]